MKKHALKLISFGIIAALLIFIYPQHRAQSYNALDQFGFTEAEKSVLGSMLKRADVTIPEARATVAEVVSDVIKLVEATQKTFVVRKGNQERWEVEATEWMKKNIPDIKADLTTLGFMDAVAPQHKKPDAVCILGATYHRMKDRLDYAAAMADRGLDIKQLILLAGERYVTVGVDGSEDELRVVAEDQGVEDFKKLTETHMMKAAYKAGTLVGKMPMHLIDTPRGDLPRPTTQTTMLELLKYLASKPEIKHVLFVSNQPYVKYQKAIISAVLAAEKSDLTFEVVGSAVENPDEVQPLIEGLGSFLYAATPEILAKLNVMIEDTEMRAILEKLYAKNPSLYGVLGGVLKK